MVTYRVEALTALGDPTRRSIFELLGAGPSTVGALAEELPISRPAVSQHLKVLKDARLVLAEVQGTRHVYRLDPTGLAEIRSYLDRFWSLALTAYAEVAAEQSRQDARADRVADTRTTPDPPRSDPTEKELS